MRAEWIEGSKFIRVYDDDGSYEKGSAIRFAVGVDLKPPEIFFEVGIGRMTTAAWRAIRYLLRNRGFLVAHWDETIPDPAGGPARIVPRHKKV